jgi:hypothetical protein
MIAFSAIVSPVSIRTTTVTEKTCTEPRRIKLAPNPMPEARATRSRGNRCPIHARVSAPPAAPIPNADIRAP